MLHLNIFYDIINLVNIFTYTIQERRPGMNQNMENINIEIKHPEAPEEPASAKKKSKLPIVITLSSVGGILVALAVIAAILFIPIMTTSHWENTANEVFFNTAEMAAFSDALSSGAAADITLGIDKELTGLLSDFSFKLSAVSSLSQDSETGSVTLSLEESKNTLALSLIYDKESVAVGVYDIIGGTKGDASFVSIPRENISEGFKTSVFSPESGSSFALEKEVFDEVLKAIETFEELDRERDQASLEASFKHIADQIADIIKPEVSFGFADSGFALEKEVAFKLNREDLSAIIDVIISESEENEQLRALLEPQHVSTTEDGVTVSLIDALKDAKAELPAGEVHFSYTASGKYVRNINYSLDDPEDGFEVYLDFTYGEDVGFDMLIKDADGGEDNLVYRKNDSETELKTSIIITADGEELEASVTLNRTDDSLLISASSSDSPDSVFELRGSCKYDPDAAHFSISFNSIKLGETDAIEGFSFELALGKNTEDISMPEAVSLFEITEKDLEKLIEGLPKDTLANMVKNCTGKELESFLSADGKLMLNSSQYVELATAYANAYSIYLANAEIMRADAVYIPVPELGINVLLYYDQRQNMIFYNFAYNMTEELLRVYHPAFFDANGNLYAHVIDIESHRETSCLQSGRTVYRCSVCGITQTYTQDQLFHSYAQKQLTVTSDNGKTHTGLYNYCEVCGTVVTFEISGQMSMSFIFNAESGTYQIESYRVYGDIKECYGIPLEFAKLITVTDIGRVTLEGASSARLPEGMTVLPKFALQDTDELQVLILPSTLKSIEDGAISSSSKLHTVFYCGTEAEFALVDLGDLEALRDSINFIFCPEGATPDMVKSLIFDTKKTQEALAAAKNAVTQSNKPANEAAKQNGVALLYDGKVDNVICDNTSSYAAIYYAVDESASKILIFDLSTVKDVVTLDVAGKISFIDLREGYLAYACEGSFEISVYEIATSKMSTFSAKRYSNLSWDSLSCLYIHNGKVYTATKEQHCNITYYDIASGKTSTFKYTVYSPDIYINREQDRMIVLMLNQSPKEVAFYDLSTNTQIRELRLDNFVHDVIYMGDHLVDNRGTLYDLNGEIIFSVPESSLPVKATAFKDRIAIETLYEASDGNLTIFADRNYNILSIFTCAAQNTVEINLYAEKAIVTKDGDLLLYTPGGYGLILVDIN